MTLLKEQRKILVMYAKVRLYLSETINIAQNEIQVLQLIRDKEKNLWRRFLMNITLFKLKRQRQKAIKLREHLILKRLSIRCQIFRTQYDERNLKSAIRREDYEEAVVIRDKMNLKLNK